jgi:glycosyltransferase involved in cell wall biosynthesis
LNPDFSDSPLTILFETHKYDDPGHHWQMAANFRKVFLESENDFIFINPCADKAREADSTLLNNVGYYSYVNVESGKNFYLNALSEVDKLARSNPGRHLNLIFLWLPELPANDLNAFIRLTTIHSISISGISFALDPSSGSEEFYFEKEFSESEACKKLWVWVDIPSNRNHIVNSKLRRLPEFVASKKRIQSSDEMTIGFFGRLSAERGLPEVLLLALFNPRIRFEIRGSGYLGLYMWRATKYKLLKYTNGKRKPWAAVLSKILNRFYFLLRRLPNVDFNPTSFNHHDEFEHAIANCSAVFYAAKLPITSGVALTSLASGTPLIWLGSKGEAVKQFLAAFPEGRISTWELFIPKRIERKLQKLSKLEPKEIYSWDAFKTEILDLL